MCREKKIKQSGAESETLGKSDASQNMEILSERECSMRIQLEEAAAFLKEQDDFLILCHQSPDGDTMGSAFALYFALLQLGKRARIECADGFPERFCLCPLPDFALFEPKTVVAVDVADTRLLGAAMQQYAEHTALCIDHHPTNTHYAERLLLWEQSAAACEIVYHLLGVLGTEITPLIAGFLYMGISTDTGCFKFSNTTAETHMAAAELIRLGADYIAINIRFFDTKSKGRLLVERQALESIRFFFGERCALMVISRKMIEASGADESELDGVSAIPRQIEGVQVGITLREREDGKYKVSVRTGESVDASKICGLLGGGGHMRASGCTVDGSCEEAVQRIVQAVADSTGWNGD